MPEIAVEVQSPKDSLKRMRAKAHYYLAHGSRLVWLVLPATRTIEIYTADDETVVGVEDTLTAAGLLPDFVLPVAEVFEM